MVPWASGPKMVARSSTDRQEAQSFPWFLITEEGVEGHGNLDELYAVLGAGVDLLLLDGPGGIGDLGVAGANGAEPGAGAGGGHVDANVRMKLDELFSHGLADGEDGAGAGYGYCAAQLAAYRRSGRLPLRRRRLHTPPQVAEEAVRSKIPVLSTLESSS